MWQKRGTWGGKKILFCFHSEILRQKISNWAWCMPATEGVLQCSPRGVCPDWWNCGRNGEWSRQQRDIGLWERERAWEGRGRDPVHLWPLQRWRTHDPVWKVHGEAGGARSGAWCPLSVLHNQWSFYQQFPGSCRIRHLFRPAFPLPEKGGILSAQRKCNLRFYTEQLALCWNCQELLSLGEQN